VKQLVVFLVVVLATGSVGCAANHRAPTIRGIDLYARVGELDATGRARVPSSSTTTIEVRRDQYLVDHDREQIFVVAQLVAGCNGLDITDDADCTLALVADQRFTVEDVPPDPRRVRGDDDEGDDLSPINKARITLLVAGVAMGVGAVKCDQFDGCGDLLAIGAGLDALVLLLLFTGMR
jgi:hypothetical protein